ncbi:putative homeobox-leucine zipper protein HOX26 [Dichanthelium oligosanthes]|uniref:Putative homeobox-leucine zipper protein HOX26 n=1 Tax=Dichanthelium oligosanthes TaxID=888268 RepID=A0A1E5UWC5_9POAL|nr:putative homeobox-leucine zipper protein HOX26 [Dichanthelium oligosanthes]
MSSLTTAGSVEEHYSVSVEEFGTHLSLGIGGGSGGWSSRPPRTVQLFGEVLSLQDDGHDGAHHQEHTMAPSASRRKRNHGGSGTAASRQNKKARKSQLGTDYGDHRTPTSDSGGGRKKLRLTDAQAAMLENSFRAHNILSHAEKQELARRVGLSARQVEVWFQNRRARTKLKQTEVDCDLLRRWCDRLTDENARLRRDLANLRASARLAVCASCCDKQVAVVAARAGEMA